jgi:antitoxin VapB
VGMNIKNAETERLTRELAALTGESLTEAITTAVRERLDRLRTAGLSKAATDRAVRILVLGREIAPRLTEPWASREHGDLLYDEAGLPR